jgi:hypothetical protein
MIADHRSNTDRVESDDLRVGKTPKLGSHGHRQSINRNFTNRP